MIRVRRFVLVGALAAALAACGLSITGVAVDPTPTDGGSSASSTSSSSSGAVTDGGTCTPPFFGTTASATRLESPITVDGHLDEWSCADFVRLDPAHAQLVFNDPQASVDYAMGWDSNNLYFAFRVTDTDAPNGTDDGYPYNNDAIELYLGPYPPANGGVYGPLDVQLIVDWRNDARTYNGMNIVGDDAGADGIRTMTSTSDHGFIVEGVMPSALVSGALQANEQLSFDVAVDERRADARRFLFNYQPDASADSCTRSACDTRLWGELTLAP